MFTAFTLPSLSLLLLSTAVARVANAAPNPLPSNSTSATIDDATVERLARRGVNLRFPYGSTPVRGVNIGGWLVLEPWITPSLFERTGNPDIVDEWTFGAYQDYNTAQNALQNHWNTFYTESDFAAIAGAGLNHVRIPIGYWAFDISRGEPYHTGQYPYLQKAVQWAANHGLKVLIDLHGVPGSQNGFDNSGHYGPANWASDGNNIGRTNVIIQTLAHEFSQNKYAGVVTSIAPINEPAGYKDSNIITAARKLYESSYQYLRHPFSTDTVGNLLLVIHDAFQDLSTWSGYMTSDAGYDGVAMDTHSYNVFSPAENALNWQGHINTMCERGRTYSSYASSNLWVIVGEWTLASTDCAKYLNGRKFGARYDGSYPGSYYIGDCGPKTGSANGFSSDYKNFMRKYYEAQVAAYEQAGGGWIFWTWKAENAADWSYQAGLNGGWIPYNPGERIYGNQCGY